MTGETRTIFWRIGYVPPPPLPPTVNITLRRVGDATFRLPLTTFYSTDAGKFTWKVPAELASQDDYFIRVLPNRLYAEGRPHIMSSKSKPFTIINKAPTRTYPPWAGSVFFLSGRGKCCCC